MGTKSLSMRGIAIDTRYGYFEYRFWLAFLDSDDDVTYFFLAGES